MRITAFFLLVGCLQVTARGFSQKVTLSEKNVPLQKVFKDIHRQTGFQFFYQDEVLAQAGLVTIEVKDKPLEEVLAQCFRNLPIEYSIEDRAIMVKARAAAPSPVVAAPPPNDIHGRVTDSLGTPMAGASVTVKGTRTGTQTDANGDFVLKGVDPAGAVLVVSFTGYGTQEVALKGRAAVVLVLRAEVGALQDVVINKGYYTESRRTSVSNVSKVSEKEIERQPVNNPLYALEGRVPGLFITQGNGLSGGGTTVRIQGQNSIASGNDPLYVIDGVPYVSQLLSTSFGGVLGSSDPGGGYGNPLNFINPGDIESIEILKDADATAIYGSRAANGAILITTKRGKPGQTKVGVNLQTGWGSDARKLHMLSTPQYLQMRHEAKANDNATVLPTDYDMNGVWDTTRTTDWQKELVGGTAQYNNFSADISGGTPQAQYLVGANYHRETSVFTGDFSDQKASVHFNINSISTDNRFHFQLSGNFLNDDNKLPAGDLTPLALLLAPDAPSLYNSDGSLNWAPAPSGVSTWTNPIAGYVYETYQNRTNNLIGNSVLSYEVLSGLDLKANLGYTYLQSTEEQLFPLVSNRPENRPTSSRAAQYGNNNITSWIAEPQLNYTRQIHQLKLEALAGTSFQQVNSNGTQLIGLNYNSDAVLEDIHSASTIIPVGSLSTIYKYNAFFGRVNFNWQDKYIVNINSRRDGSSRFGSKNQFHNFESAGAAWIFSKERLLEKLSILSFGKLRGSYGTTGNDLIGDYRFMNLYSPYTFNVGVPYQNTTGLTLNGLPNPYLEWEETRKLQVGIDLGFLRDRITLTANYVRNRSSNQLLNYALPIVTGFANITENFPATVQNTEWEFTLSTTNVKTTRFTWTTSVNLTIPKNTLVAFPNLATSTYASSLIIGQSVAIKKVYHLIGVDPITGLYQFANAQNAPVATPNFSTDRTVLVDPLPEFYGGLENNIAYKGFLLDFLFQGVKQRGANFLFGNGVPGTVNTNEPVSILDRWQKSGDRAPIEKYNSTQSLFSSASNARFSDAYWSDASYIRLKNVSISWQLPAKWQQAVHLRNCSFFAQGQNLLTITRFKGLDPENQNTISLPPLRVITIGIQFGL